MTNEHKVRELCRHIRGVAMTYPSGFEMIAAEVRALWAEKYPEPDYAATIQAAIDEAALSNGAPALPWREEDLAEADSQTSATPKAQVPGDTQGTEKRKRGRPRKVRTEG